MIDGLLRDLQQPEYVHVLINPLPVYGLAVALFGLLAATYFGSHGGQRAALVVIFAVAASAWPVAHYGDEAFDRVLSMSDETGQAWLEAHARRADNLVWMFYVLAAVSAGAIFVPGRWPRTATPLLIATILLAAASLGAGGYIAYTGGKIRHREFRNVPPPPRQPGGEMH